jgi:DNA ligase (NAD+)
MEGLKHFVSKEALNIDGFGKKIVEKFWELKLVKFPQDIFNLDFEKIKELDGWGDLSVSNLKYAIEKSKKISLDKFIYSLGIRHIGQENAKLLAQHLKNFENFYKLLKTDDIENLLNIDGIGETQIKSIRVFFSNKINLTILEKLNKSMKVFDVISTKKGGILKNKAFMFTGKLKEISRAEAKSLVEQKSGKIISNVNRKLNYLVIGEKPTNKKIKKAKELNIRILTQDEWMKMLNKTS